MNNVKQQTSFTFMSYDAHQAVQYSSLYSEFRPRYFDVIYTCKNCTLNLITQHIVDSLDAEVVFFNIPNAQILFRIKNGNEHVALQLDNNTRKLLIFTDDIRLLKRVRDTLEKNNLIADVTANLYLEVASIIRGEIEFTEMIIDSDTIESMLDFNLFKLAGIDPYKLAQYFIESDDSLLLLYGKPGLGKSKLALALAYITKQQLKQRVTLTLIKSREILGKLITRPELFYTYSKRHIKIFVFDDIDYYDLRRGSDKEIDAFVNFILSITDGTVPQYNKFIITTNQKLKEIDRALLRPGRLFGAFTLQPIKYEELKEYNPELAERCLKYYNKDVFTLAEINEVRRRKEKNFDEIVTKPNVLEQEYIIREMGF